MTFKELFSQFSFADIRPAFLNLWQTNEPKLVEHLDLDKWERIYQNVQALEAKSSQYYIRLVWRWETCSPMIDMNCSVYDKVDNHLDCPMACYPSWSEIAGMEVVVEKDIVITPQELVAGLLWEITYFGTKEYGQDISRRNEMKREKVFMSKITGLEYDFTVPDSEFPCCCICQVDRIYRNLCGKS